MAKKPLVYVVTTNLNWDPRWAKGDTDEERLAWQKSQGKSEFKAPTMTEFMQWTQVRDIIVPSSKEALAMYNTLEKEDLKIFESIAMFRILFLLGYVDNSTGISAELTANGELNQNFLKKYRSLNLLILKIIHKSVSASGL